MKKNIKLFIITLIISFGVALTGFRLWDIFFPPSPCSEQIKQSLGRYMQHLLHTKDKTYMEALFNAYPVNEKTQVKRIEIDGSLFLEDNLKDYLLRLITISEITELEIDRLECNPQYIQTIILITKK